MIRPPPQAGTAPVFVCLCAILGARGRRACSGHCGAKLWRASSCLLWGGSACWGAEAEAGWGCAAGAAGAMGGRTNEGPQARVGSG